MRQLTRGFGYLRWAPSPSQLLTVDFPSLVTGCLAASLGFASGLPARANLPEPDLRCGPNCLYAMLVSAGFDPGQIAHIHDMPVTGEGASMLSLKERAARSGLATEVRRYPSHAITEIPTPAILQFRNSSDAPTRHHFRLYQGRTRDGVRLLDGTTGETQVWPTEYVERVWTGYALVQVGGGHYALLGGLSSGPAVGLSVAALAALVCWQTSRREPQPRGSDR